MRGPEGGFCSALDADSEGVEGKFYVWTEPELRQALGDLYEDAVAYFRPRAFEDALVLEARGPEPQQRDEIRARLYEARSHRVAPGLDDKRLTTWNALMISALAEAGAALARPDYVAAAVSCAEFLLADLRDPEGRLLRTWKDGHGHIEAYLDDHAHLLQALTTLYEATFDPRWYTEAVGLADTLIERFSDHEHGGFFTTAGEAAGWPRRKDFEDSPVPAGNSSAAYGLLRLSRLSGRDDFEQHALAALALLAPIAPRHPLAFGHALQAFDFSLARIREVAIVGPESEGLLATARAGYRPHIVLAGGAGEVPLLEDRAPVDGRAAAYVCEHFTCQAPVTEPEALAALLAPATGPAGSAPAPRE
jgi:hypothetical protein